MGPAHFNSPFVFLTQTALDMRTTAKSISAVKAALTTETRLTMQTGT